MIKKAWFLSIIFIVFNYILFAMLLLPFWFKLQTKKTSMQPDKISEIITVLKDKTAF